MEAWGLLAPLYAFGAAATDFRGLGALRGAFARKKSFLRSFRAREDDDGFVEALERGERPGGEKGPESGESEFAFPEARFALGALDAMDAMDAMNSLY